jgi:hypothetical protein
MTWARNRLFMEMGVAALVFAVTFLAGTYAPTLRPADPLPDPCPSLCGMKSCRLLDCINRHSGVLRARAVCPAAARAGPLEGFPLRAIIMNSDIM